MHIPSLEESHIENGGKGVHGFEKERLNNQSLFKLLCCLWKFCLQETQQTLDTFVQKRVTYNMC